MGLPVNVPTVINCGLIRDARAPRFERREEWFPEPFNEMGEIRICEER